MSLLVGQSGTNQKAEKRWIVHTHSLEANSEPLPHIFSHGPVAVPPWGRVLPTPFCFTLLKIFVQNSCKPVDSISAVMWSTWNILIFHIAFWLAKIAFWSLQDCSALNKIMNTACNLHKILHRQWWRCNRAMWKNVGQRFRIGRQGGSVCAQLSRDRPNGTRD